MTYCGGYLELRGLFCYRPTEEQELGPSVLTPRGFLWDSGGSGLTDCLHASVDAASCSCSFEYGAVMRVQALRELLDSLSGCELLVLMDGWECKGRVGPPASILGVSSRELFLRLQREVLSV